MTLQDRRSKQRRATPVDASHEGSKSRALVELSRLAATENASNVASAVARFVAESLGAESVMVVEYGSTPGRLGVTAVHGLVDFQPGARIPSSPLLTPSSEPLVTSIIDANARSRLPGSEKPRAALAAPIPGPYAAVGSVAALFSKPRDFADEDVSLVQVAASLLGASQQKESASAELASSLDETGSAAQSGRVREHAVLAAMARAAAEAPDLDTTLASICEWAAELIPYDRIVIGLIEHDPPSFKRAVFMGEGLEGPPAGERYLMGADELDDLRSPSVGEAEPAAEPNPDIASMRAPVLFDDRLIGVLWLGSKESDGYTSAALETLGRVADYIAPIVESAILREKTRDTARDANESAQHLAAVLAAAPIALVAVDGSGMCTLVEGRLVQDMGAISNLIKGHSLFELTGRHPQVEEAVRSALRGIPSNAVLRVGRRYLELSAQPVHSKSGGIEGVVVVGADITERTAGEAAIAEVKQLQMAQDERARLMSAVSHELRNPLQSVVTFIDVLAANQPGNLTEEQERALSIVQHSAERLNRLIGDLHDLARLEAGLFTLNVVPLDVDALITDLVDTYQTMLGSRNQTLIVENKVQDWVVHADELRLSQAVANLLSNASKYSPEGSSVTLGVAVSGDHFEVSVTDEGPGIPEELRSRVFDAGYRIDNDHSRSASGSGLGLAIVKRIVDLHGGSIELTDGPGGGTSVSVLIPGVQKPGVDAKPAATVD